MFTRIGHVSQLLGAVMPIHWASSVSAVTITAAPNWHDIATISKAHVSIEVCFEPPLRSGHPPLYSVLQPDPAPQVVQGFITPRGERKVLAVSKRDTSFLVRVIGAAHATLKLAPLAVAVVTLPP